MNRSIQKRMVALVLAVPALPNVSLKLIDASANHGANNS